MLIPQYGTFISDIKASQGATNPIKINIRYLVHLRFGIKCALGDVIVVECLVVGPEGALGLAARGTALGSNSIGTFWIEILD